MIYQTYVFTKLYSTSSLGAYLLHCSLGKGPVGRATEAGEGGDRQEGGVVDLEGEVVDLEGGVVDLEGGVVDLGGRSNWTRRLA